MEKEKLDELQGGIYESLTEEQKEKVKACQTPEELIALAGEEGIELPDEALDAVTGGYVCLWRGIWRVVDDKTDQFIGGGYDTRQDAKAAARRAGVSDEYVDKSICP